MALLAILFLAAPLRVYLFDQRLLVSLFTCCGSIANAKNERQLNFTIEDNFCCSCETAIERAHDQRHWAADRIRLKIEFIVKIIKNCVFLYREEAERILRSWRMFVCLFLSFADFCLFLLTFDHVFCVDSKACTLKALYGFLIASALGNLCDLSSV